MDTDAKVSMGFYSESLELSNNDSHVPYQHNQQEQPLSDCINNTMVGFSAGMEFNGDEELRGIRRNSTEFEPLVGMEFDSLEAGKLFYYEYAVRTGFRARAGKCRTSLRDDSVIMKQYTCVKEGFSVKKQRHGDDHKERRNRKSMREGCKAMIQLSRRDHGKWVVSKFIPEHSHPFVDDVKVEKVKKRRQVPVIPAEFSSMFEGLSRDGGNEISLDSVLGGGESFGLLEYLKTQQSKNPLGNLTVIFGDVVMFDTSYKDNKQMLPFAAFTGYNHHLQPPQQGFSPAHVIGFCKWRILSKCKEKLPDICSDKVARSTFKQELKKCIDESQTIEDF
ncbi:protein FAR1-RELATED SEQUENCE 5-like [Dioscorea cayenensis subsp. rotundata]|uniref:Protein FAR1-RELATED SEQUENCE 5-like n=1 Tax=Dioscorea cayennensis subsp. rotundata TaxID=55577 RepID=A0AB40C1V7_DIOCR|nr:protein FAR1-RELATED SEQUENCE 5-like [Dioscorea cayenensis subsp. rotundata]